MKDTFDDNNRGSRVTDSLDYYSNKSNSGTSGTQFRDF